MFCNKRRVTPYVPSPVEQGLIDYNNTEFYQPSMVDDFLFAKNDAPYSDAPSVTITSDITMLFNQKRLDKMTLENLVRHFDSMAERSSKFADLRSKLSDDQLCNIVKSRYIQSPSELLSYSEYLVSAYGDGLASLGSHVEPAGDPAPAPAE